MSTKKIKPGKEPEYRFVRLISRMLELPPADRVLSLRAVSGHVIQLVLDSERPLTLRLDGPWSDHQTELAHVLMQAEAESRPHLARLHRQDGEIAGVVFTSQNEYSASAVAHKIATKALGVDAAQLKVEPDWDDYDARPEIATALRQAGKADIHHRESGVRIRVKLDTDNGYTLAVPVASLGSDRGHRDRARRAIEDRQWRNDDGDIGSGPDPDGWDGAKTWGYSMDQGDAKTAADAALQLLCKITESPLDIRVTIK